MNSLKYIILPASPLTADMETPILFPQTLLHAAVTLAFAQYGKPIAAGFCWIRSASWICEGRSSSLGLASRGRQDAEIMEAML